MAEPSEFPLEKVTQLLAMFGESNLSELEYSEGDLRVVLRKDGTQQSPHQGPHPMPIPGFTAQASPVAPSEPSPEPVEVQGEMILAPMTGLFYRAPAPGEPAFVNVGDTISVGQIIGLIEAMKVFSEVPADKAGRITAILAKNGELIEEGQPILRLVP